MRTLVQNMGYGLRALARTPAFTTIAVLTLALGIGANTAIFSLVNGVLLRSLPYPQPDRLVSVTGSSEWDDVFPQGAVVAMQGKLRTMNVAGFSDSEQSNLTGVGEAVRLRGAAVSANLFSLLGPRPEMGRAFLAGEDQPGRDDVVILSHGLWRGKFGGDANVIGRSVMLEGTSRQVVGVMPEGFQLASSKEEFWIPLHLDSRNVGAYWGSGFMPVIGRLRDGVTIAQARAEIRAYVPQLRKLFPWQMPDVLWADCGVISLQQGLTGDVSAKLLILLGAIGLVLVIACVNVANLLLARAATRQKEIAVRAALGAGRWRICRQLLTESVMLAAGGGMLGLLLAINGLSWLKAISPADTPRLGSVSIDWRVMAFTAAIAIVTGVIFGLVPALHASKIDLTESLKSGWQETSAAKSNRLRNALAIAEIAVAVVLVIGAGLLVKSLWELAHVNPGFRTEAIVTARISASDTFCADGDHCKVFFHDLLERTRAIPGVMDAALVNVLPLSGRVDGFAAAVEGHPQDPKEPAPVMMEGVITPGYFRVMNIPLLRGRGFSEADMAPGSPPVALISDATARKFWPKEDPVGKHIKPLFDKEWITIVGVVGDVNQASLASRLPEWFDGAIYDPFGNAARSSGRHGRTLPAGMTLVARTRGSESGFADALQRTVLNLNSEVPVSDVKTMPTIVSESMAAPRSTMALFAVFAGLALILGAIGIYGVISYTVAQRTPEIGIRMALGAQGRDVLRLVMGQGTRVALLGVAIGIAGALAATRLMASLLFGVTATDPATFAVVAVLLVIVALAASFIPARRAMRLDPLLALRYE
ncbi:MAG TPA: ABC transporter permease [Candidatus Acidoferrales bacterium]|nr:ABC transporter permease [Candidatus Acidoferrales bacterium]